MTTHLLVLYKSEPTDGEELKYSLRSLEKNLHIDTDYTITVVGDMPTWIQGAEHLHGNPHQDDKVRNMMHNVVEGCRHLQGEERAYFFADDYILMDPTEEILPCYWGRLADQVELVTGRFGKDHWYSRSMKATYRITSAFSEEPRSWDLHRPMPLQPARAVEVLSPLLKAGTVPFWRTTYGELAGFDRPAYHAHDGKYHSGRYPIGVPWVSTDEAMWQARPGRTIRKRLDTPSRWE